MNDLSYLAGFVEGTVTPAEFSQWLYDAPEAERLLCGESDLPQYARSRANLFLFLIEIDYDDPAGVLNAQGLVSWWLERKGVAHQKSPIHADVFSAMLKAQPRWLDLPRPYLRSILAESAGLTGKELTAWLKAAIAERFKFLKAPPKWLQSPEWMFEGNRPLIFVGQFDISALGHDAAQLYVFFDPDKRQFAFVTQSA